MTIWRLKTGNKYRGLISSRATASQRLLQNVSLLFIRQYLEIVAAAKVASKAITITEIVKRRISKHGGKVIQMTRVEENPVLKLSWSRVRPKKGRSRIYRGKDMNNQRAKLLHNLWYDWNGKECIIQSRWGMRHWERISISGWVIRMHSLPIFSSQPLSRESASEVFLFCSTLHRNTNLKRKNLVFQFTHYSSRLIAQSLK